MGRRIWKQPNNIFVSWNYIELKRHDAGINNNFVQVKEQQLRRSTKPVAVAAKTEIGDHIKVEQQRKLRCKRTEGEQSIPRIE